MDGQRTDDDDGTDDRTDERTEDDGDDGTDTTGRTTYIVPKFQIRLWHQNFNVKVHRPLEGVSGLTLTLDYTHFTRQGMPDADIGPLVAYASHFHVRGAKANRLQASFNENTIDYLAVLRAMKETEYRGYLGVEYVWIDWEHCNEVDNVSETILYRDFLKENM